MDIEAIPSVNENIKKQDNGQIIPIVSGHFVNDAYAAFMYPLLPLLIEKFSLSYTTAGSFTAIAQLPAVFNPIFGYLIERYRLYYLVILAPALTATSASLLGLAPTPWLLGILLFVSGISTAIFHAPAPAMVGAMAPKNLGRGMSWFMAAGEFGYTLGPILIVWAVSTWTLEGSYRIMVIGWAASLVLYLRMRRHPILQKTTPDTDYGAEFRNIAPALWRFFIPMSVLILMRNFMTVLIIFMPTFMTARGAGLWLSGASLSIMELSGTVGALIAGPLSDRWGRKPLILISSAGSFIFFVIFLNIQSWLFVPALVMIGMMSISSGPILLAIVQDHFPSHRAVSNGIYMALAFLFQSLSSVIIGTMGDRLGLTQAFFWCAVLSLLAIPMVFTLPKLPEP